MKYNLCSLLKAGFLAFSHIYLTGAAPAGGQAEGNAPDNVWPQATGGPVVLDNPTGQAAPGPSASGKPYGGLSLVGPDGNPVNPADDSRVPNPQLIPAQEEPANYGFYFDLENVDEPQPIRGTGGGTDPESPNTSRYDKVETDMFAPPGPDYGSVPQLKWPLGLSHNHLGLNHAGWARQENTLTLPAATEMAGVDMRLAPHAYRELHWHTAGEWSFIMNGSCRIATVNQDGQSFVDDLNAGDLWFFPPGIPHSIQAFDQGVEFLLVFDDGSFDEDGTSLASELFLRNPLEVIAKDLQTSIPALDHIPQDQLYIFPGHPAPQDISEQKIIGPNGAANTPETQYSYHFSQQEPLVIPGAGSLKIADPTNFPAAADLSAALVTIEPGALRELHWHLQGDEWNFFLNGRARLTVYSPPESSRTFDFLPGDVGYVPQTFAHYVENVGDEPVVFLEVLKQPKFTDISVSQWLGLTPRQVVKDTLNLPDSILDNLPKYKPYILPGSTNHTETNFTRSF